MFLLLGAGGYIGRAFASELLRRGRCFVPLTREAFDYSRFELLFDYVRRMQPEFIINAASFSGRPDVDGCELAKEETLWTNTILPQTVARVCLMTNTPWGHVSSASIYSGAKVVEGGRLRIDKNLNSPELRRLYEAHPENFYGFEEVDTPNFSFRNPPCNFYSGSKALAEEAIRGVGQNYIWRFGEPFSETDEPGNLLTKLQRCSKIHDNLGSISHVEDSVRACLNLWDIGAAFGTYNVTSPGAISTRQIVEIIQESLLPARVFSFWKDDEEFYRIGSRTVHSHAILNVSKLAAQGIQMRPVRDALRDSLKRWRIAPALVGVRQESSEPTPTLR